MYGKSRAFRATLEDLHILYAAEVLGNTQVYLQCPKVGVTRRRHKRGKTPSSLKVLSRQVPHEVRALARSGQTTWQRVAVRTTERGELIADFAVRSVWTLTKTLQVRREWLVFRRDDDGKLTCVLLNVPRPHIIDFDSAKLPTTSRADVSRRQIGNGLGRFQARSIALGNITQPDGAAAWFVADVN